MEVYVIDYDVLSIKEYPMGDVCDLDGFNSEMNQLFEEWFSDKLEARYALFEFVMLELDILPDYLRRKTDKIEQYYDVDTSIALDMLFNPESVSNVFQIEL